MKKLIAVIGVLTAIFFLQFGVFASFPFPLSAAVLPLSVYILLLYTNVRDSVMWWAVVLGCMWDLFSYYRFGVYTLSFVGSALVLHWLFTRVVTNTSLFSFVVFVTLSTLVYSGFVLLLSQILGPSAVRMPLLYQSWTLLQSAASTMVLALLGYGVMRLLLRSVMPTHV